MKRYFAMVLAVVLLCICTGAVAMGWGRADNPPPPRLARRHERHRQQHQPRYSGGVVPAFVIPSETLYSVISNIDGSYNLIL